MKWYYSFYLSGILLIIRLFRSLATSASNLARRPFYHSFQFAARTPILTLILSKTDEMSCFAASMISNKAIYKGREDLQKVSDLHTIMIVFDTNRSL